MSFLLQSSPHFNININYEIIANELLTIVFRTL